MVIAYIAFGSNLGDKNKNIQKAISLLKSHPQVQVEKISSIIETEPENTLSQSKFLNGVAEVQTNLSAEDLLKFLQEVENQLGRQRPFKNSPRTIDLDILFYNNKIIDTADLKIPHPHLHTRAFVLRPLCEIAPDFVHPVFKKAVKDLAYSKTKRYSVNAKI